MLSITSNKTSLLIPSCLVNCVLKGMVINTSRAMLRTRGSARAARECPTLCTAMGYTYLHKMTLSGRASVERCRGSIFHLTHVTFPLVSYHTLQHRYGTEDMSRYVEESLSVLSTAAVGAQLRFKHHKNIPYKPSLISSVTENIP